MGQCNPYRPPDRQTFAQPGIISVNSAIARFSRSASKVACWHTRRSFSGGLAVELAIEIAYLIRK